MTQVQIRVYSCKSRKQCVKEVPNNLKHLELTDEQLWWRIREYHVSLLFLRKS